MEFVQGNLVSPVSEVPVVEGEISRRFASWRTAGGVRKRLLGRWASRVIRSGDTAATRSFPGSRCERHGG